MIISFTGTHGIGKTDAALNQGAELKRACPGKSVHVLHDLEAFCPFKINGDTTEAAQTWLFAQQIRAELSTLAVFDIVVSDRTLVDVIAYTYVAGFIDLADGMLAYARQHVKNYHRIYFKKIINNDHCHADGIRDAENKLFRQDVEDVLGQLYVDLVIGGQILGKLYFL